MPGSKSITNRALLIAALAEGKSVLRGVLFSDDSRHFLQALIDLGFEVEIDEENAVVTIVGCGGMIPKLQNCIDAIESGVNRVHILDGRIQHCLLLEIFTNKGIGTAILREGEGKYYNEENK